MQQNIIKILLLLITLSFYAYGTDWTAVDNKINEMILDDQFSGCVLGVYTKNSLLYKKAYGTMYPKWGLYAPLVTTDMVFDINYLTQVIGINSYLMQAHDLQTIQVSDRVSRYLSQFDNNGKRYLTISNMLLHNSGLQFTITDGFGNTPAQLLKKIDTLKLQYKEDTKFQYSELGYVALGQMIAKKTNKTLDSALFEVLVQAGLRDVKYLPKNNSQLIVPSGYNSGVTKGTASNKIAHFLGSVAGNAGLFSNVDNIGTYIQLLLNKGKMPSTARVFSEEIVDLFTKKAQLKYKNTRALGWDTVTDTNCPCGQKFGQNSFGLADPTGSYVWADKDKGIAIVLLANGQYPAGMQDRSQAQGQLSDAIMTALGY